MDDTADDYDLTREQVLVACWWLGIHGSRAWRERWGGWAQAAHQQLAEDQRNILDPPAKPAKDLRGARKSFAEAAEIAAKR